MIPPIGLALHEPAEQERAPHSAGVGDLGCAGGHELGNALELLPGNDGGKRLLTLTGVALSLAFVPQTKNPGISLVDKDGVDAGLAPLPSSGTGDAPFVEGASDVSHSVTSLGQVEDAPDDGSRVKWRASH